MQTLAAGAGEALMGRTDDTLAEAERRLSGIRGSIALVRERQGGMTSTMVRDWVRRLRAAADKLEELA